MSALRYPTSARRSVVLAPRLEDREHLVPGANHGVADGDLAHSVAHDRDQPRRPRAARGLPTRFPAAGEPSVICTSTISRLSLRQLEQVDEAVLGHLVLDERQDPEVAQTVGVMPSRSKCCWLRGSLTRAITFGDAVLLAGELADHEVVLVVAGDREDDVGRTLDPGALEHVELGRVAAHRNRARTPPRAARVAVAALLDQRHLVAHLEQRAGDVRADLAAAGDDQVHQASVRTAAGTSQARTASTRSAIARLRRADRCAGRACRRTRRGAGRARARRRS